MKCFTLIILSLVSYSIFADVVVPTDRVTIRVVVRAEATSQSADVGSLRPGEQLEFVRNVPRWREVRLSPTETGFVTKSFTTVIDDFALNRPEMLIHFLNTGTGSCAIVECPGPNAPPMIVDCGSIGRTDTDKDATAARTYIKGVLDKHPGIQPNLVLSHADRDHYNLLPTVLTEQVNEIWQGGNPDEYTQSGFPVWIGIQISGGAVQHNESNVLSPNFDNDQEPLDELPCGLASAFVLTVNTGDTKNAESFVLQIEYDEFSIIFTGDATGATEAQAMANYSNALDTTVLTGSHHGAHTEGSNGTFTVSNNWASATNPEIMVYQSGTGFGHPRCTITDSYDDRTVTTTNHPFHCGLRNGKMPDVARDQPTVEAKYATEKNGTIVITTDGVTLAKVACDLTPECASVIPLKR